MTATGNSPSLHAISLWEGEIVEESDFGSMRRITVDDLPILNACRSNGSSQPGRHAHTALARQRQRTHLLRLGHIPGVGARQRQPFASFMVSAGEMFHIDSGSLHHIENIGEDAAEFILTFRSERPEDFGLAAAFGAMTDAVLGNTYDLDAADFAKIRRDATTTNWRRAPATPTFRPPRTSTTRTSSGWRRRARRSGSRSGRRDCAPAVLARPEGSLDVLAADPRRRHARTTLASDHRRDGLCQQG